MNIALPAYEFAPDAKSPRSQGMARARRTRPASYHRRRSEDVATVHALQTFWDEHAIKAGIVSFWLWFGVANWSKFQLIGATLLGP